MLMTKAPLMLLMNLYNSYVNSDELKNTGDLLCLYPNVYCKIKLDSFSN